MPGIAVRAVDSLLFVLPSDQIVLAVVLNLDTVPLAVRGGAGPLDDHELAGRSAAVLEQCAVDDVRIKGLSLADYLRRLAEPVPEIVADGQGVLAPERHQLLFARRLHQAEEPPGPEAVQEILRSGNQRRPAMPPHRPEQLNRSPMTLGVVTAQVSVLYGHEAFVEDTVLLSTVNAVGTAARFRHIWQQAHDQVLRFNRRTRRYDGRQSHEDHEMLADHLGNLEFDLSFSVAYQPGRIDTFDVALFAALDLPGQATTLSRTFKLLDESINLSAAAL